MEQKDNNAMEEWRDVEGYIGYYQVSNFGRVRSMDRHVKSARGNGEVLRKGRMLKPWMAGGYYHITFSVKAVIKTFFIHKLVAIAFVENPEQYKYVNHIDENKLNNVATNLEWCTSKYNRNYGNSEKKRLESFLKSTPYHNKKATPVIQYDKNGNELSRYESITAAAENGIKIPGIVNCCRGRLKTYKGCVWKYETKTDM